MRPGNPPPPADSPPLEVFDPLPWSERPPGSLRVALLSQGHSHLNPQSVEPLRATVEQLAQLVLVDLEGQQSLAPSAVDVVVVLGGDGSILRAARTMGADQVPVLGVNLGKLGFLADIAPAEFGKALQAVCDGRCRIVTHMMFDCQICRDGQVLSTTLGLNETAVLGGPPFSILELDLYIDGELATTYSCDGLIISTPVGSTAHSLSAGGPILRKDVQAFVISAVSPHTLTVRPVVDTANRVYEVVVQRPHESTSVVVDGQLVHRLQPRDRVRVRRAAAQFRLIEVAGHSYYRTLREKLGWGGRIPRAHDRT